jgi:hypothetical protein
MSTEIKVAQPSRQIARQQQSSAMSLFQPTNFNEAWEFARVLADSGMIPKAYVAKPAAIISTWQLATELNVGLMQALQGVSNINGTPAVFGDLGWALVQNHPDFVDAIEEVTDTFAVCTLKRRGRTDVTRKYTLDMAKAAGLMGKDNWKNHPRRMLQWRARSWAMRDLFADALKGMVIYEEAQDFAEPSSVPDPPRIQATIVVPAKQEQQPVASITAGSEPMPAEEQPQERVPSVADEDCKRWATGYFRAYSTAGKLKEESLAFLKQHFDITDSRLVPFDKREFAMKEATAGFPSMKPPVEENMDAEPPFEEWTGELPTE